MGLSLPLTFIFFRGVGSTTNQVKSNPLLGGTAASGVAGEADRFPVLPMYRHSSKEAKWGRKQWVVFKRKWDLPAGKLT